MKILVAILILANLSVFVWHFRWAEEKPTGQTRTALSNDYATRLVLAKERPPPRKPTPTETEPEPAPTVPEVDLAETLRCYTVGPFAQQSDATRAKEVLAGLNIVAVTRLGRDHSRQGYWVYLPPPAQGEDVHETMLRLKRQGVKDFFRVATGEHRNAISLGLFSRSNLAQRRQRAMRKQGFQPQVDTVSLSRPVYWLEWPVQDYPALNLQDLDKLEGQFAGIGQMLQACAEP